MPNHVCPKGNERMSDKEPILTNPASHEMAAHVRDYSRFTGMMKWGTIATALVGAIVVLFVL